MMVSFSGFGESWVLDVHPTETGSCVFVGNARGYEESTVKLSSCSGSLRGDIFLQEWLLSLVPTPSGTSPYELRRQNRESPAILSHPQHATGKEPAHLPLRKTAKAGRHFHVQSTCTDKHMKILVINDNKRVRTMGQAAAADHSHRAFKHAQKIFAEAGFGCKLSLHLVGQVNMLHGNPTELQPRRCNTTFPNFEESYDQKVDSCCNDATHDQCQTLNAFCVSNLYNHAKGTPGCFDVLDREVRKYSNEDQVSLATIGRITSSSGDLVDGYQYLYDLEDYVYTKKMQAFTDMYGNFDVVLLVTQENLAGEKDASYTSKKSLCSHRSAAIIQGAGKLVPAYLGKCHSLLDFFIQSAIHYVSPASVLLIRTPCPRFAILTG